MKGRHQRRTLAASGHIAAAQVGNDGDARQLGQQGWAVELQRVARAIKHLRTVAHGLPMGAKRGDLRGLCAASRQQLAHHLCIVAHQRIGSQRGTMQLILPAGCIQCQQLCAQCRIKAATGVLQHFGALAEIHQYPVHPVQRGAGHQADIELALGRLGEDRVHGRSAGGDVDHYLSCSGQRLTGMRLRHFWLEIKKGCNGSPWESVS